MGPFFAKKSRYWQQKLDSFTAKAPPTLSEAFQLFDRLAALSHITHDYPYSGCEARAHLMCVELMKCGYLPRKAWVFETPGRRITFKLPTPAGHRTDINWYYHVAPVLVVNAGPAQGGIIPMVFDPSLLDGPTSAAVWAAAMQTEAKQVHVTPLGTSAPGHRGDYIPHSNKSQSDNIAFTNALTDADARRCMDGFKVLLGDRPRERVVFSCGLREPQYHSLWRTEGAVAPALQKAPPKTHSRRL